MAKRLDITEQLRRAIEESPETYYRIAKESGVNWSVIDRFVHEERDIRLDTAAKLASYLRLHLAPL